MKKLVNFVIEKKYLMLLLFIVFAIACIFLSQKVTLNYEISEYLPSNSNVRQGLDIMNKEFSNDSSTLNIMFDNLKDGDKENILMDLKKINGVESIEYDYSNKYQAGSTIEVCPAELSDALTKKMQSIAEDAYKVLGVRCYARFDFLMDKEGNFYCLEGNTLPGMTTTSLLPQEAKAVGIGFEDLCEKVIEISLRKY